MSSTLSPDSTYVAALGWNEFSGYLTIINLKTHTTVDHVGLATPGAPEDDYSVAADGPLFSPDGKTLWVPQSTFLLRFSFDPTTGTATQTAAIPLCGSPLSQPQCDPNTGPSNATGAELPSGMAYSPDGSKLYVALNGANKLAVIDNLTATTPSVGSTIPVGNAPRQVVISPDGTTAYASNEGGRPAKPGEFTKPGKETQEIPVGLQPTALYQNSTTLFVANSNDDSLSVIDKRDNQVTQTVNTNPVPGQRVGSYANAISMVGHNLLVSIGRDNAIAVYRYRGLYRPIKLQGLLPTDWYPVQVQPDPELGAGDIIVTNDKGIGAQGPPSTIDKGPYTAPGAEKVTDHNTYDDTGSVTVFPLPGRAGIQQATQTVYTANNWEQIKPINQGDYDTVPKIIPAHLGDPSPIKHVVIIIRENRTYDQVLGDLGARGCSPTFRRCRRSRTLASPTSSCRSRTSIGSTSGCRCSTSRRSRGTCPT